MDWLSQVAGRGVHVASLLGVAITVVLVYIVYLLALPRPIPGIPYNEASSKRFFGDLTLIQSSQYRRQWIWSQPRVHHAPISQAFLFPFRKPTVIVSDYREVVDICSRRVKEFDRGSRNKEFVGMTAPNFHFTMNSSDPRLKIHRELLRDLMTPWFLRDISAPRVYDRVALLVELWGLKQTKAQGRPFSASHDIYLATLDIICSVAFGMEETKAGLTTEVMQTQSTNPGVSRSTDDPVDFPPGVPDPEIEALLDIPDMGAIAQKSAFPVLSQRLAMLKPKHARAHWYRRSLIQRQTAKSVEKLSSGGEGIRESALDQLLWREMNAAKRAKREPDFYSPAIRDEILGFLLGGHDTTATVTSWWVKYMTNNKAVQGRLRNDLRQGHSAAFTEGRRPTMSEICTASIPYLDAVMEESLRCSSVVSLIMRKTTCDTQILGYAIPKGTDIVIPLTGPSMTEPALPIPESLRSAPCREAKDRIPAWGEDVGAFRPERWLKMELDANGIEREVFDAQAGPNLALSSGPRQCFGKKLAYLQLRTLMTLLTWNFEFEDLEKSLNGWEVTEKFVNVPMDCYVKLGKA